MKLKTAPKKTTATERTTPASIADETIQLPRVSETENFALFKKENEGGGFGSYYMPLADAKGVTSVSVVPVREK